MKLKHITLAALLAACAVPVALAQGTSKPLSREEVKAEGVAAHKAGAMVHGEASTEAKPAKSTTKTREQVKAEGIAAHKAGAMEHGNASRTQKPQDTAGKSTATRKEVKAAAEAAHKDGTMTHGEATPAPAK
jgi:hypothetical protein